MPSLKGSCLCGQVTIEVHGEIECAIHCHCSMCRKAHGAQFASFGVVRSENIVIRSSGTIRKYRSSPTATRTFCECCGSNIEWIDHEGEFNRGRVSFSLGLLDTECVIKSELHFCVPNDR
ncbi:GFA family protein [Enterovibrio coralii]|uniref:GFA family protein n=1 Tax=Enterovibrio coralii TaxID=294935 RepID=UPI0009F92699